jgi:hypothetical protein
MKLAKQCLDYSIVLIKINFAFILVLQTMRFLIYTDMTTQQPHALLDSSTSCKHTQHQQSQSPQPQQQPSFEQKMRSFRSRLSNLMSSWNSYDINQLEATKTEIVNVFDNNNDVNSNETTPLLGGEPPFVTIKSFINFTELIQYNNLKNMLKLAFVLNLNLTTLVTNLIVISYLLVKSRANYALLGVRFGPRFFHFNLAFILTILVTLLSLNTLYLFLFNDYFKVLYKRERDAVRN